MPKLTRTVLLEVPASAAFAVVADVEAYPEFLPACDSVEVLSHKEDGLIAKVTATGKGMTTAFVTRNVHMPDEALEMRLVEGPLQHLLGKWAFKALGDHGCRVTLDLEYEVGGMLGVLLSGVAEKVADRMVDAFCQRMRRLASGV
ncbi:MAG: type II toxin-antitoxin system RatA family toxin [Pseudomonadota bacterium]